MKILIVHPNLWSRNGAAPVFVTKNIADELKNNHVFFFLAICKLELPFKEKLLADGFFANTLNNPSWFPCVLSLKLYTVIKKYRPEVIHLNQLRTELLAPFLSVVFPHVKIITTKHGFYEYYDPIKKNLSFFLRKKIPKFLDRFIDKTITISNFESNIYISHGLSRHKIITIYNGISNLTKSTQKGTAINVVSVGKLEERKGHKYFIQASAEVLKKTSKNISFSIYGIGKDYVKLQNLIYQLGCENKINLLGYEQDKEQIYSNSSIYVHTAINEAFGLVVVEAMQYGIPVVAFDIDALPEIVSNGETGFLVPVGDVAALADKVELLVNNPNLILQMGNDARKRYEKLFTARTMALKYEKVYNTLSKKYLQRGV